MRIEAGVGGWGVDSILFVKFATAISLSPGKNASPTHGLMWLMWLLLTSAWWSSGCFSPDVYSQGMCPPGYLQVGPLVTNPTCEYGPMASLALRRSRECTTGGEIAFRGFIGVCI